MACSASLRSAYKISFVLRSSHILFVWTIVLHNSVEIFLVQNWVFFFFCTTLLQDLKAATSKVNPPYLAAQVYFFLVFHLQDRALILNVNFKREFT